MSRKDKYLITQSLLSSWQYIFNAYDTDSAHDEFLSTLSKERQIPSEVMQKGINFENMVVAHANNTALNPKHPWTVCAQQIGNIVKGGQFQVKAHIDKAINNIDFRLYGRLDCLKAGTIIDIKYSERYEVGKFINSPQHSMYFEIIPEANRFIYLISDGNDVFEETYMRKDCEPIHNTIQEFICYLKDTGLFELYSQNWKALGD